MSYASDHMIEQIYNKITDEEWLEYCRREENAQPQTLADVADPYAVGYMEAEQGQPCEPLTHYARLGDIEQYICGHKDAPQAMDAAAQRFGLMLGAMVGTEELVRLLDTVDYEQDILDREDHSRGGW